MVVAKPLSMPSKEFPIESFADERMGLADEAKVAAGNAATDTSETERAVAEHDRRAMEASGKLISVCTAFLHDERSQLDKAADPLMPKGKTAAPGDCREPGTKTGVVGELMVFVFDSEEKVSSSAVGAWHPRVLPLRPQMTKPFGTGCPA